MRNNSLASMLSACLVILAMLGAVHAQSTEFSEPTVRGVRVDLCKHNGRECGKPAADLFCREMGFSRSIGHVPDPRMGARGIQSLIFGDGMLCNGPQCRGFGSIICLKDEVVRTPVPQIPELPARPAPEPKKKAETQPVPKKPSPTPQKKRKPRPETAKQTAFVPIPVPRPSGVDIDAADATEFESPGEFVLIPLKLKKNLPAGARLTYCTLNNDDCEFPVTSPNSLDPAGTHKIRKFQWSIDVVPNATIAVWQVSTKPFPAFTGGPEDTQFEGLVKYSVVADPTDNSGNFAIDFGAIEQEAGLTTPPDSFYVRIIPFSGLLNGQSVGQPSNVIQIFYGKEAPPLELDLSYLPSGPDDSENDPYFRIRIKAFTPPDFDKGRWGCVVVVEHPTYWTQPFKDAWPIGSELCPKPWRGDSGKVDSFDDFVEFVFDAWDWVGDRYDDLVELAVDVVLYATPLGQQCKAFSALVSEVGIEGTEEACTTGARVAVKAGMTALGLPPTIPSYNELVDQGVDYAVELAADEFEAQTGIPCVGPCEDAFRLAMEKAADNVKRQPDRTACVDPTEAHRHGREPMCLDPNLLVRPAPGTRYVPPVAEIEVTRRTDVELPWGEAPPECYVFATLKFENFFEGGTVYGKTVNQSIQVKAQKIEGRLFKGWDRDVDPAMSQGKTVRMVAEFNPALKHQFPWTKELWRTSQIVQRDELGPFGPNWFKLFLEGQMTMTAGSNCAGENVQLQMTMPDW